MEITKTVKRRSVSLMSDELTALKKLQRKFNTTVEAAEYIGIHRNTLIRIIQLGSGSPANVELIRKAIK